MSVQAGDMVARTGQVLGTVTAVLGHAAIVTGDDNVARFFFLAEIQKADQ